MADQTVRVRVTQEDIDAGERADCVRCPVARAVCRDVPGAINAWVNYGFVEVVVPPGRVVRDVLPDRAILAIVEFDSSGVMEPFEFDLTLPTTEAAHRTSSSSSMSDFGQQSSTALACFISASAYRTAAARYVSSGAGVAGAGGAIK